MKYLKFFILFVFVLMVGCSPSKHKKEIATTIYPFKAILQEIVGDRFEIKAVLPPGADPHTYEMIPSDFKSIQNSLAFFYGSDKLDGWAAKIDVKNKIEMISLVPKQDLLDITVYHREGENEHLGIDPHFWTDPMTVKAMLPNLVNALVKIDPNGEKEYRNKEELFSEQLIKLDSIIKKEVKDIKYKNVFTAHPFYNYFFNRYGFNVVGSLEITPGTQATPKELKNLIELVQKENVKAIFVNKQESDKPAQVLAESAGIKEFKLNALGGVKGEMTYEEIILHNLSIIKEALK